jgi:hypothetical protein
MADPHHCGVAICTDSKGCCYYSVHLSIGRRCKVILHSKFRTVCSIARSLICGGYPPVIWACVGLTCKRKGSGAGERTPTPLGCYGNANVLTEISWFICRTVMERHIKNQCRSPIVHTIIPSPHCIVHKSRR